MSQGWSNGSWNQGRYGVWSYQDCAASTTSTSSFTASAAVIKDGQIAISAASVVTASGERIQRGAASATASSSITAAAVVVANGAASIAAASTATASSQRIALGAASLDAASTATAAADIIANAAENGRAHV